MDPDDKTPLAIKNTGARVVSYGAPVLPGAMFLLAYLEVEEEGKSRTVAVMGLPGCVMYAKRTIFDLVLPRVMADDEVTEENLASLGQGGLCLNCPVCTFPNCGLERSVGKMDFSHFDEQGNAWMVDVGGKEETKREATARGSIFMSGVPEMDERGSMKKAMFWVWPVWPGSWGPREPLS